MAHCNMQSNGLPARGSGAAVGIPEWSGLGMAFSTSSTERRNLSILGKVC